MKRVAIITSSDMGFQGKREDLSGPAIKEIAEREGYQVVSMDILPDDHALLAILFDGIGLDIAFVEKDLRDVLLQVGSGNINGFVLCRIRVPDTGQHICYGIGDLHVIYLL